MERVIVKQEGTLKGHRKGENPKNREREERDREDEETVIGEGEEE